MREKLKDLYGKRLLFSGRFVRTGVKGGYKGPVETILLEDISHDGHQVADHLWFNRTKGFKQAHLQRGDDVQFVARCEWYEKGYKGRDYERQLMCPTEWDLHLTRPTKITRIRGGEA